MERMDATKARELFADTIDRVRYTGERVVVRKRGKDVAAIVSMSDLAAIEAMEDHADAEAARDILRDPKTVFVPYPDARRAPAKRVKSEKSTRSKAPKARRV